MWIFPTQLAIRWLTSLNVCTTWGKMTKQIMCWNEWKTSVSYIYPDLRPPTAIRLQGLTVIKQCVYQTTFRNVYECKKWLVKSGLVWSRTLSTLLSMNAESVSMPVFAQCAHNFKQFCCRHLKNETIKWNVSQSVKNVNKIYFCALYWLSNNTALGEKAIFRWFCFLQVVRKQTWWCEKTEHF